MKTIRTRMAGRRLPPPLGDERGIAVVLAMLMLVLLTGLGMSALMLSRMDAAVTGYYRSQRTADAATDSGLEMAMAMIFNNVGALNLPIGVNGSWTGSGDLVYSEGGIDITINVDYKQEDMINYNDTESYSDEVVRYGKDYMYLDASKDIGRQPVYTVTFTDNKTGKKAEADLISSLGFQTPAAIFVKDGVQMMKNPYATEEKIEITSGTGTPALSTTRSSSQVFIQRAVSRPDDSPPYKTYRDQNGSTKGYYINAAYLYPDVYTTTEIAAEIAAGRYNNARDRQFCLLGVGDRNADLDANPAAFNFDQTDPAVIQYNYTMPGAGTMEDLIGAQFADFRDLADQIIIGNETVQIANGSWVSNGKNLSGFTLGTSADPQIVFFESNMNDDGTYTGARELTLATTGGSVQGYGILIINGDANIQGSINWQGLMLVRGDLTFRPWQGGTPSHRSGPELSSRWNGWIMVGKALELWTWYGGSIILGYSGTEAAQIKGIIAATIPHKVLSWRRLYD